MKFNKQLFNIIAYTIIIVLFLFLIFNSLNRQFNFLNNKITFREKILKNSNTIEGFTVQKKPDDLYSLIERKLKSLTEELGNREGLKESKEILKNTKKICDLECAKCMMNMIQEEKGLKSIDLDNLANDDSSENCIKCKKYTALSQSIKNMIDSL